ncbi:hypothetical protein BGW38_005676 [Lunasporangiospora selenospora]|uniref:SAC domain-containing protein n=1 Tax=Lunasporangiospora selenospora TaxID=979761 RepID=A0A9P6G3D4_9FUNG|nr:hypothetical protein BGW38_005676 [Lunasporangiospora selenospora]
MVLHNSLRLYSSQDTFVIEPVYNDPSVVTENVVIHRATGEVRLNAPAGRISPDEEVMTIYGIMGFIRLLAGEYMVVITDRTRVGRIVDHDIFKLKDYKILPVARNNLALSDTQADERFFWNYRLQSKFIEHTRRNKDQDLSNFILPVVNGFVEIKAAEVNKKPFTFALVSRRSRHRAGTRYFSRGVDQQGNVSNFNETEQIVVVGGSPQGATNFVPTTRTVFSHVQTRGSIPIFWAQINNIKYTPKLQVFDDPETENAFRRHFEAQKKCYGPQLVVNLVNKKGYEGPMGAAFSKQIDVLNDPQIKYYHFDFHHECSKMRWNRVSLVLDYFHHDLIAQRYYKAELGADGSFRVLQRQASVMRTNCMDCLDRTNVVQSVVSRWVLNRQLQEVGILAPNELFETSEQFEPLFRTVWADNADVVSCAYSGTGALKTDFTRTGRRTKAGAFQDFQNSAVRYVKNNFMDGSRQDAYDLFLGYDVHEAGSFPLADTRPVLLKMIPLVLFVCFAMVTISLILPETLFSTSVAFFIVFWIAVAVYVIRFILANGMFYVNWPRLVPLGYDIPLSQYSKVQVEPKLGGAEVELGWKNE